MKAHLHLLGAVAILSGGASVLSAQVQVVEPGTWKIEPGFNYSRGDYGLSEDTEVYSAPVSLSFETGPVVLRASIAWVSIKGPATIAGDVGVPARPTTSEESGLGDLSAGLTYKLPSVPGGWNASATGRVKFATANESRGLGTGANDYHAQFDLMKSYSSATPFLYGGYRWLGDSTRYQLRNGPFAGAGLAVPISPGTTVSASGEWRRAIVSGGDDAAEASLSLFHRFQSRWSLSLSAMSGFNDASPRFGAGISAGYSL